MEKISIVFQCWRRLEYTKKTLKSLKEHLSDNFEYEFVLMYDEYSKEYLDEIEEVLEFDKKVINYDRELDPAQMMNFAISQSTGDYHSYWQNDWIIIKENLLEYALKGIKELDFDFIRLLRNPYSDKDKFFSDTHDFGEFKIREYADEYPNFQFCFNPQLRKEKWPFGMFEYDGWFERDAVEQRKDKFPDWKAGCLDEDYVRHIGKKSSFKMEGGGM